VRRRRAPADRQRVDGIVRVTDRRDGGRSYLVAEDLASIAELEGS